MDFCGSAKTMPWADGRTPLEKRGIRGRHDPTESSARRQEDWEEEIHVFRPGAEKV